MENPESARISIIWRGEKYVVGMNLNATLQDLGNELVKLTNVESNTMRLIVPHYSDKNSKLLSPFTEEHSLLSLQETSILQAKSIRMMGASKVEVDEVVKNIKVDQRIAGFDEEEKRMKQRSLYRPETSLKLPQGTYIFCDFRTLQLPGIQLNPPPSEALKRMHKLAADPGIVAIMNKHRWRVGIMTEMAPIGYVGVSPKCILGFNKNQGEEISLRLRTDDLKGFRKYESIKKTLLHELAHMVYSEHDGNFYTLDKQLNQEAEKLDWTKSGGHTLSGYRPHSNHYEHEFDIEESSSASSQKLGGKTPRQHENARAASVNAAYNRLAYDLNNSKILKSREEPDPDLDQEKMIIEESRESDHEDSFENHDSHEHDPDEADVEDNVLSESEEFSETNEKSDHESNNSQGIVHGKPDPDDKELQRIQDPVFVICSRLKMTIEILQSEVNPIETSIVFQTLFKIIRNVIEHPNEMKFKRLRMANSVFQRNVANYKAAMDFLFLIGFYEDVVMDEIGKAETYLVLKRNDPGLLWLAKSSLESCFAC